MFVSSKPVGVLLLHGIAGTPTESSFLQAHLRKEGYRVVAPLIPGLALGTDPEHETRWQDWAASVLQAYDDLADECSTVFVGGMSAGALLSLKVAATKPDKLGGLLLFGPTFEVDGWSVPRSLALFKLVQARWLARRFTFNEREPFGIKDERMRQFALRAFRKEGGEDAFNVNGLLLLEHRRLAAHVRGLLPAIKEPTLVIHPREDDQSDLGNAFLLQRQLGGIVEALVLDNSYHIVTLDTQRDVVARTTARFLETTLQAGQAVVPSHRMPTPIRRVAQGG